MKTDVQIKSDVKSDVNAELLWDSAVNATSVGVAVKDGIVTLSGTTDTYMQKHAVERAARRVSGVRGIAVDLEVRLSPGHARTDTEIAQAAANALRWHSLVPQQQQHEDELELAHGSSRVGASLRAFRWRLRSSYSSLSISPRA